MSRENSTDRIFQCAVQLKGRYGDDARQEALLRADVARCYYNRFETDVWMRVANAIDVIEKRRT